MTFLPWVATLKCLSRIRTDMDEVSELTRREDRTIPARNQTIAIDRPRMVFGYLSPYLKIEEQEYHLEGNVHLR